MINPTLLPATAGVYLFKDNRGTIIYVGKAKNLRNRVKSYFSKNLVSSKTKLLVKNIADIDHITVDNEIEALLLENKLIKKHQPKYNIMAKDAKTFAYIKITEETYPRIISTRRVAKKGMYFGPYTDGRLRNELIRLVIQLFHISVCKPGKRECLNYHIGLCQGTCTGKIKPEEYQKSIDAAISFLKGNYKESTKKLQREMKTASELQRYERALELRKQIESVELLKTKQKVDLIKSFDQNIIALKRFADIVKIIVFKINKGVISGKKEYSFPYEEDILQSFTKMYYSQYTLPKEILLSERIWHDEDEKKVLELYFERLRAGSVRMLVPLKGEKKALVTLAVKNIGKTEESLLELQKKLTLPYIPRVIECFDISNLGQQFVVAGMVQWIDARPNKNGYRRFEMKSVVGQDDFASMKEVIRRRYCRLSSEQSALPDLIILDGGRGQLNAGLAALKELDLQIPMVALAKQEEEIYVPGLQYPLKFEKQGPMMLLMRSIRDSAHRFVLSYNRKKRQMELK